jgi:hypothetical protein
VGLLVTPDADARFELLQTRLVDLWPSIRTWSSSEQTVVVVPSYSIDREILEHVGAVLPAYEERFLYMLLVLRQRRCRVVFVTSAPVDESILNAYLELVPDVDVDDARSRLSLVSVDDMSARPLAEKVLDRPDVIDRIRTLSGPVGQSHLAMFNVAAAERDLALLLDIPIFGAAPHYATLGTKAGCRVIFAAERVPHPAGEPVATIDETIGALKRLRANGADAAVLKLNEGVSGYGNAVVPLDRPDAIEENVRRVPESLLSQLEEQGGIVEELISGDGLRSPSVQLRITPLGSVEILSTHDQVLGGPAGQTYIGCSFPADPGYGPQIAAEAAKVGRRLAAEGVQGRFAVDFVVRPRGGRWDVYAIEINLRKGGTTHPFLTMHFLVDGTYDVESATYIAPDGSRRCYAAADALGSPDLSGLAPDAVLGAARRDGLLFDLRTGTGVVFHMLTALPVVGRFGLTAIADSPERAQVLWQRAADVVAGLAVSTV